MLVWGKKRKATDMKGKRYTTEDKIRILREADRGERTIPVICREANISEVTFHRWKKQFGQLEVNEARRLKELERENTELKKMLAESLLKMSPVTSKPASRGHFKTGHSEVRGS